MCSHSSRWEHFWWARALWNRELRYLLFSPLYPIHHPPLLLNPLLSNGLDWWRQRHICMSSYQWWTCWQMLCMVIKKNENVGKLAQLWNGLSLSKYSPKFRLLFVTSSKFRHKVQLIRIMTKLLVPCDLNNFVLFQWSDFWDDVKGWN